MQRQDIQGLRAIAVLAVIAAHVLGSPDGGFVGVDVFFVVSGFLITGLLLREVELTNRISFTRFYVRRAKRILPAAAVVLTATVVGAFVLLGRDQGKSVALDALYSALFLGNWRFAAQGVDYFQQGTAPSPLQHFWSLGVEEQFYLVWPWVLLLVVVLAARFTKWSPRRVRLAGAAMIFLLTTASFAWAMVETTSNHDFAYFSTFSRAWELGIGALLAFVPRLDLSALMRRILAWIGLVGIVASLFIVSSASPLWPAPLALLPVLSTALVLLAGVGARDGEGAPWILRNRIATYVGDISYSLYLWHFPIAILLVALIPAGSVAYIALALLLTFVASMASYHFVENPARRAVWFRRRGRVLTPSRAWLPLGSAIALIAVLGAAGHATVRQPETAVAGPQLLASPEEEPPESSCWGAGSLAFPDRCADVELVGLAPSPTEAETDTAGAYACYSTDGTMQTCHYGSESHDATRIALVGDSHAASLLPALRPRLEDLNWSMDTYVGRGCGLVEADVVESDCALAQPEINERLLSGDYDSVLVTSTRKVQVDAATKSNMMARLEALGTQVVVITDNPLLGEETITCTTRVGVTPESDCSEPEPQAMGSEDTNVSAADIAGVEIVDLTDLYCLDGRCPGIIGNVIVYRDAAGHITGTWARTLSPYLVSALEEHVGAT
ncbi:acyltransferase family protein [Microbacterium suaedae]|uniref:acyltransferase family protein n=1 Tax=Microbacterium suaedae TaxID=2067813 RepID=UPI0013A5F6D7|nr:acyltransferase family protein [Microbacterium suaedae]